MVAGYVWMRLRPIDTARFHRTVIYHWVDEGVRAIFMA